MKLSKQKAMESVGKKKQLKQNLVRDPRFSRLHSDPRFQRAFKRKLKIPIDSRFGQIFSDNRFLDPLSLDKRGRKIRKSNRENARKSNPMQQYYRLSDDDDDDDETSKEKSLTESLQHAKSRKHALPEELQSHDSSSHSEKAYKNIGTRDSLEFAKKESISQEEEASNANEATLATPVVEFLRKENSESDPDESSESDEDPDGEGVSEESSESSSSSSSGLSSDGEDIADSPSEEIEEEKVPVTDTETRRLALVNMDWDHLRAVDILAVMNSFLPKGGQILSVSVFPSEFGLQQMKEEERRGPQIFQQEDSDDDDQDDDEALIMDRLRKYEKDKLRYYYAVVECDSKETANFLYKSCDGMEFERSANTLDLRFIPDEMEFINDPRDVAKEVPTDYQVPSFETRALQHSRVKLTWDDDEPDRVKTLHQKFNTDQLNDMDFKAYLASDVSESESIEDAEEDSESDHHERKRDAEASDTTNKTADGKKSLREKYRALLLDSEDVFEGKDKSKDQDLEITFNSGLEELSKRLMDKTKQKGSDETVWEAHLRRKKEKRRLQKEAKIVDNDDGDRSDEENGRINVSLPDGDAGFDDPFFKSAEGMDFPASEGSDSEGEVSVLPAPRQKEGARAQKRAELEGKKREEERNKAELELLFADELASGNAVKGYNLKKRLKDKKKDANKLPDKLPTVNYDDPRFSALFTSHRFAIDPTEPEFKRSAAQLRPLLERQQKHLPEVQEVTEAKKPEPSKTEDISVAASKRAKQELSMMVRSLKRKVGAVET